MVEFKWEEQTKRIEAKTKASKKYNEKVNCTLETYIFSQLDIVSAQTQDQVGRMS